MGGGREVSGREEVGGGKEKAQEVWGQGNDLVGDLLLSSHVQFGIHLVLSISGSDDFFPV